MYPEYLVTVSFGPLSLNPIRRILSQTLNPKPQNPYTSDLEPGHEVLVRLGRALHAKATGGGLQPVVQSG